ncbi:YqgE/AlgH family protein [Corynebacterium lizhenjunii]|uniref:YqgE/AlgH family protein n=1 Tax=Corynebacterium lizhenjunii TaxID=2709394 RepID=A0A7T0KEJ2_9CORY|nr:YqgE/AlgH family protein [Corynebacterium lizhenjunii]QPK79147.1 YqgE/AlgH family protein [Corynebacterium lizhenjunii]
MLIEPRELFTDLERNPVEVGQLLIAAPNLEDQTYSRNVVIIYNQTSQFTEGLMLNRVSDVAPPVRGIFDELYAPPKAFYYGGDVEPMGTLTIGVVAPGVNASKHPFLAPIAPRVAMVDVRAGEEMRGVLTHMRSFLGRFIWDNQELERQIEDGDWYVAPALASDVIAPASVDLWAEVMRRQPMPLPLYSTFPQEPYYN